MKNTIAKGAIILAISGVVCKFFGALFRLPLTNIIGIEGIGIFQMIMSLYSLSLVFISNGITLSLSKLVSSARASGNNKKLGGLYRISLVYSLSLSFIIGLLFFIFACPISSAQGCDNAKVIYFLFIILLPLGALIGVYRGIIQGFEMMSPTAFSQIIEQVVKFAFGLFFAFVLNRKGYVSGVLGAFLGIVLSEFLAFFYLAYIMIKKIKIKPTFLAVKKEFFSAALPLSFSSAISPFTHAIEAIIIIPLFLKAGYASSQASSIFGLQTGMVGAILNFPMIISLSVAMALLPKISFLSAQNDEDSQKQIIKSSFNILWYLLIPLILGITSVSRILYPLIYPSAIKGYLSLAVQLTNLGAISVIFSCLSQFFNSLVQAKGYYNYSLLSCGIGGAVKIILIVLLTPISSIAPYAIVLSNIAMFSLTTIFSLIKLKGVVTISLFEFILPLLAGLIMFLTVKILLISFGGIIGLLFAVLVGGTVYLVACFPLTKVYATLAVNKIKK